MFTSHAVTAWRNGGLYILSFTFFVLREYVSSQDLTICEVSQNEITRFMRSTREGLKIFLYKIISIFE